MVLSADEELFRRAMDQMRVSAPDGRQRSGSGELSKRTTEAAEELDDQELFLAYIEGMRGFDSKDLPFAQEAARSIRRVKAHKGELPVNLQDTLDLHGLTTVEALNQLMRFVTRSFTRGMKSVMVITGKGKHSADGVGVLKREVEKWILQKGKRFIHSYAEAPRAHGGKGAFILYLRRD